MKHLLLIITTQIGNRLPTDSLFKLCNTQTLLYYYQLLITYTAKQILQRIYDTNCNTIYDVNPLG